MCKNGEFSEKNQKTPSNFIFYPKVCYHLPRYSPGNLKKLGRVVLYKVIEKNGLYCPLLVIAKEYISNNHLWLLDEMSFSLTVRRV